MSQYSYSLDGNWLDLHTETGEALDVGLLVYCDGGGIAVAVSATTPANLAIGVDAEQGEQVSAGGDGTRKVWARATSGSAIIRVQADDIGAARKSGLGHVANAIDDVHIDSINALQFSNVNATQFGEDLVASRTPIIELNSSYGFSALRDLKDEVGTGAVSDGSGTIDLNTGTTTSSSAELDSAEVGRYVPGFGAQIGIGVRVPTLPTGNHVARWGGRGANEDNAVLFGIDTTGIFTQIIRGGSSVEKVYQSSWNIDPLDGTGRSGYDLDPTDGTIYQIEFTWYGYGEILWGVIGQILDEDGVRRQRFIPCHQFRPSGDVSLRTPNLRLYAIVENGATASDFEVQVGGRQYSIVGTYVPKTRLSSDFRGSVSTSTTVVPLVSAQRKTGFEDRSVKLAQVSAIAGNANHLLEVRLGGSLTGASFGTPTNHTAAETALEYDTSATAISGGIVISQDLIPASSGQVRDVTESVLGLDLPDGEVVTLCARTITGTSTIEVSKLQLREEW